MMRLPAPPVLLMGGMAFSVQLSMGAPANAARVVIGGETYEIAVEEIAYNDQPAWFALNASGGRMPWWGSSSSASLFAAQVGSALGPLGPAQPFSDFGPLFAYDLIRTGSTVQLIDTLAQLIVPPANSQFNFQPFPSQTLRYAVGSLVNVPAVPAPLPILGASLCFGWSRHFRRRIKASSAGSLRRQSIL